MNPSAAIDLGSHTARLLIARRSPTSSWGWLPIERRRAYVRLAADEGGGKNSDTGPRTTARIVDVLSDFARRIAHYHVKEVRGVATGIIREPMYGEGLLSRLYQATGIRIELISGEREARLSGLGARRVLCIQGDALVFDLGGSTTEFLQEQQGKQGAWSIPLGAAVLTRRFIHSDPPRLDELKAVSQEVQERLRPVRQEISGIPLAVGTGGTVVTLAAMVHGISWEDISPERLNGLRLSLSQMEACLSQMKMLTSAERSVRLGLDPGRADVIVAGALAVVEIMRFLESPDLTVGMSDLLEGLLIESLSD